MKKSEFKSYDDLPLFLNAELVAQVLGIAPSSAYELMHEPKFPTLRIGNRMVVPRRSSSLGWRSIRRVAMINEKIKGTLFLSAQ